MPNYENGVIYKIYSKDPLITDIYIGSTTNFKQRKGQHKCICNNEKSSKYNTKIYKFIRENGGWDNFEMVVVEHYSCDSKLELLKQERYFVELLKSSLNFEIPGRTKKEWEQDNKERMNERKKEHYQNNIEIIKLREKEYYENNKEIIILQQKEYRERNKEILRLKKKEYQEINKEKRLLYLIKYRENNKEIINLRRKEHYQNNKEKIKLYQKEYYEKNKEKKYIIKLNE